MTGFAALFRRTLTGLWHVITLERVAARHHLGNRCTLLAGTCHHHLVVLEIFAVEVIKQGIRTVYVFGVDWRHDEGSNPRADGFIFIRLSIRGLLRTLEAIGKREGVGQYLQKTWICFQRRHSGA